MENEWAHDPVAFAYVCVLFHTPYLLAVIGLCALLRRPDWPAFAVAAALGVAAQQAWGVWRDRWFWTATTPDGVEAFSRYRLNASLESAANGALLAFGAFLVFRAVAGRTWPRWRAP